MSAFARKLGLFPFIILVALMVVGLTPPAAANSVKLAPELQGELSGSVGKWLRDQAEGSENEFGKKTKRGYYSRDFRKVDGGYETTAHVETAEPNTKLTERYLLTITESGGTWAVSDQTLEDTYRGLHRESAVTCAKFQKMKFEREGLILNGGAGELCAVIYRNAVDSFMVTAADATYSFEPPEHATDLHLVPDLHGVFKTIKGDHNRELSFAPAAFFFGCDPESCSELLETTFEGLGELNLEAQGFESNPAWAKPVFNQRIQERRESAFAHFRYPFREGNRVWEVLVLREVDPFHYPGFEQGLFDLQGDLPGPGVHMAYNNWGGFEVEFNVWPRSLVDPEQLFGTVYGYYSKETMAALDPYQIERRDDNNSRWHQVYKVDGTVSLGLDNPEMLEADILFGIELKQPVRELPFVIQSIPRRDFDGKNKPRELFVNSVQLDGKEITWTRTSQLGGVVVLPEEMPAGSKLNLRMGFKTRAMVRWTNAFTEVSRFGWMPFVRFADFIDEFELTLKNPSEFKVLGIGHKIEESTENGITTTRWRADSPVVFPSMTLGRYEEDWAGKKFNKALKLDGTEIPVRVHVDKDSMIDWQVSPKSLRPIAQQAINSINLFREISGLDYPYGELNFVMDRRGFLYGQAPSSLIYLGAGVFRGAAFLNSVLPNANATYISKFLKSVVAHEVGHQWWGSRVSNANGRNYWFVETLAEYFSALYLEQVYGRKEYDEQVDEWRRTVLNSNMKSSVQNASAVWAGEGGFGPYQAAVYNKGPLAFHMLREIYGDEKFFAFLKKFSMELAEKREIVTLDIQQAAERALGGVTPEGETYNADLSWFFDQWIRGSGTPQYKMTYDTRRTEDGGWLIEGEIEQRVVIGNKRDLNVLEGQFYRGIVDVTITTKDQDFQQRIVVEGEKTPFRLKVAGKPLEVALNDKNQTLAHDVIENQNW